MERLSTDVLVIGAGAAGLVSALELAPLEVVVLAKAPAGEGSSSAWAQGGIAAAMGPDDSAAIHKKDTITVGVELCDDRAAEVITQEGPDLIKALMNWGAQFDRTVEGDLSLGREAAHSFRRILHANGDSTGKEVMRALGQSVQHSDHIKLIDNATAYELIVQDHHVIGVKAQTHEGEDLIIRASAVILATGGVGNLFGYTTNPQEACGEGIAMAARAGAQVSDLEFVQFHPTAIDVGVKPMPLATEALRGEGAVLVDGQGVRFMPAVHKDAELAPRDVVARAIWRRVKNGEKVYLDATSAVGQDFPDRFPTVWAHCTEAGLDPRVSPIPVTPAAHYHMGGVKTDLQGRTTVNGLWAVGEVACTGIHGANRLASNSLLEAIVLGRRAAQSVLQTPLQVPVMGQVTSYPYGALDLTEKLSSTLYRGAGVERHESSLMDGLLQIQGWEDKSAALSPIFLNRLLCAKMILAFALERVESRGGHFRSDYPETDGAQAQRNHRTLNEINAFLRGLNIGADLKGTEQTCQTRA